MVKTIKSGEQNPYAHYKTKGKPSKTTSRGKIYTVLTYDKTYSGGYHIAQFLKAFVLTIMSAGFALLNPNIWRSFKKAVDGHALKTLWIEQDPATANNHSVSLEVPVKQPKASSINSWNIKLADDHPLMQRKYLFM